ncbi:DUF418 domain-containing protein [Pseudoduganella sp. DS3]|uniref:DUF418 domain-containing protein n=1 Tax=Pseudoduganella guangdongensis TaxID=2692179 RepID=A0A6N9HP21_9BURK|nr:DUF418 domain-containing protein [Pseudoduganella guangdongensis]MYN05491.1 DUF418 domain-containing protein [Pseudoduganella guangdongensis]
MNQHRLLNVDALRGFALLGILAVNIWAFADPFFGLGINNPRYAGALDLAVRCVEALLFETKFYLLFSFLFGYSFTLQMAAAERAGAAFRPRMLRRACGLLVLGVLHGCFLFYGDILHLYGLLSFVLVLWTASVRAAVRAALALVLLSALLLAGIGAVMLLVPEGMAPDAKPALAKLLAYHGDWRATRAFTTGEFPSTVALLLLAQGPSALAMFLLGRAAGSVQLFAHVDAFRHLLPRVLMVGLPVGLAGAALYAAASKYDPGGAMIMFGTALSFLTAPFLTAAYVAGLLMLFDGRFGARLVAALAPMGKIALTNYLMQSVILALLFTGYGLRLCDKLAPATVMALVFVIYFAQMALSAWWLKRHTYGPAEWLLRALTNGSVARRANVNQKRASTD